MQLQVPDLNYKTAPIEIYAAAEIVSKYRATVRSQLPTHNERIKFWRETLTPEIWQLIKSGDLKNLEAKIKNAITSAGLEL